MRGEEHNNEKIKIQAQLEEVKKAMEQDKYTEAYMLLKPLVDIGNMDAKYSMGYLYLLGLGGVKKDIAQAIKLYEEVAKTGHTGAQYNLGLIYSNAEGISRDYKKSFYWFKKAAENGLDTAQLSLGASYFTGTGTKIDLVKAWEWLQKSAEQGNKKAQEVFGANMFGLDGKPTKEYYKKLYDQGRIEMKKGDYSNTIIYFEKACEGEVMDACFILAMMYLEGNRIKQDGLKAKELLEKGCANDDLEACSYLALMYSRAELIPQDLVKSTRLLKKACSGGWAGACYMLASRYYKGIGVGQDHEKAISLYKKACDEGIEKACEKYKMITKKSGFFSNLFG